MTEEKNEMLLSWKHLYDIILTELMLCAQSNWKNNNKAKKDRGQEVKAIILKWLYFAITDHVLINNSTL